MSILLPKLAAAFERSSWSKRQLKEGWVKVTRDTLAKGALAATTPSSADRTLLFIHGTFSNAASAYGSLASSNFFDRATSLYGDRIFAFNHFTLSRTPQENARMLLDGLPDQTFTFDVITHSRGGLVLRNLVERASKFGSVARRFQVGRAVLVASPNDGTPLATPMRWQDTVGWIANLLELFPDNPFTTGAEFIANALVWMARHASGDLPGLRSMDQDGDLIADLQGPPAPPPDAYSALVANYNPTGNVLRRLLDTGIDQFFGAANDLVVPSEGGWRVEHPGTASIPGSRIGCFGPGGNLARDSVTHLNFFSYPETVDFLISAISGQGQMLTPVDTSRALPDRRLLRSAGGGGAVPATLPAPSPSTVELSSKQPENDSFATSGRDTRITVNEGAVPVSDTLHLIVLPASQSDKHRAQLLALYGAARVLEDFRLGGAGEDAGRHWHTIIATTERIKSYINENRGQMPKQSELIPFGAALFGVLFPGGVRRLYDAARERCDRLNVIFTSTIPWVADKPWELAYDSLRGTFLAKELYFIRNVMTAVPPEPIEDRGKLRILVASAQPLGYGQLSIEEEEGVIRGGFAALIEAGLADVTVLPRATPHSLHAYLSTGGFSVFHFIGHAEYNAATDTSALMFQSDSNSVYPLDGQAVRDIMGQRGIRLIFLNACETGQGGRADFNSGIAPALMACGVPIVVANQYKVLDKSATFFARLFYWSLAQGMSVAQAAREARIAVNYSISSDSVDWAVPVLYARHPDLRLCERRPLGRDTILSPARGGSGRRSGSHYKERIAVWDTHSQFPTLQSTLDRLNQAQNMFGFDLVDLSVPIDAWHMRKEARYLDADRFAERLARQIPQVGAHYLCAIVDEPMVCDIESKLPIYNIYGWRSSPEKPPVVIFSTAGLGLLPKGPVTDRAIANVVVSGIAGYLMDADFHERPPRDCPNYYSPTQDLSLLTGRQMFCKPCSVKFKASHPHELEALNAILAAFD